jgi:hypothetical protein
MILSKIVRKLRPADYWRIGEHESWFADLAAEGLHLKKMGIHFARFEKGEPKKMKYRIEVSLSKKMLSEQIQMYAESGWEYVTSYQYFHVFSSPVDRQAPELHTDPAEQSFTLKALDKKLVMNASIATLGMILIIGMMSAIWFLDGTPTIVMVEGGVMQQTILSIFLGYLAYTSLQAAISIRTLRKDLNEGKPIDHHAPWKKHHRLHSMVAFLFTIVVGLSAIIPFVQLVKMDTKTLPEESPHLPIVRLAEVEQNPALVRDETSYMSDNVDWGNRYSYQWSLLAPVQYETDEIGLVPGKLWEDKSGEYSPSIHTKVYQLNVAAMADHLVTDLIKRQAYDYNVEDVVETKHPGFDRLMVHEQEDQDLKEVFASKGKTVIYVRYHGDADINSIIKNMERRLSSL